MKKKIGVTEISVSALLYSIFLSSLFKTIWWPFICFHHHTLVTSENFVSLIWKSNHVFGFYIEQILLNNLLNAFNTCINCSYHTLYNTDYYTLHIFQSILLVET